MTHAKLRKALRLQHVPRWSITPTINKQTVAEHSHGVAAIAIWLIRESAENPMVDKAEVLKYAIEHDAWESVTGDTPSVAKARRLIEDKTPKDDVSTMTKGIVKLADFLEALVFLKTEIAMGNTLADNVFNYVYDAATDFYNGTDWLRAYIKYNDFFPLWRNFSTEANAVLHPGMRDE